MYTPWKNSYDQPRQNFKKQRHYFANKGPSSQGYGFPSSYVWMWELDYKECWAPKNWCFLLEHNYFYFFKYKFIYFNWRLITLQYCIGFAIHQHESTTGIHMFPIRNHPFHLPPHTIPLGRPSAPAPSIQYHASNLDWWFVSYMILYMFQCHSPKSSHPLPLPQSPKDCSIHQCLFCCLAYRVIITIFLNSIYMH